MRNPPSMKLSAFESRQAGAGLIEVMVAVLVLAIGLLGIAALQAVTLRNTGSSAARTQATIEAYSMMDIIRANSSDIGQFNTNTFVSAPADGGDPGTREGWLSTLQRTVAPDAQGRIVCIVGNRTCTVSVRWDDARATGGAEGHVIAVTSQL